ncbi:MAG: ornithine carbamoyltransferase [Neomegalonema sp.]|nr:ornithine carbamoyltransferase [Neomegalonema sp.]
MTATRMKIAASDGATSAPFRHFLELDQVPAKDLRAIVAEARRRKSARAGLPKGAPDPDEGLAGRVLAMVFEKPSTRTRVSFEMGMRQLGGSALVLNSGDLQLGRGETPADTARVLSGYVDGVMLRTFSPETLQEMADHASIPVVNGLTDRSHPCQIMADLVTIEERFGRIEGLKIAWTGDGNNVAATFVQAAAAFGYEMVVATPEELAPKPDIVEAAQRAGGRVSVTTDVNAAVADADVVVTDTWLSMNDPDEVRQARHRLLGPYQVDEALMAQAKSTAIFMHCLPAHRGEEATAAVMDGPQSVIFEEAENRLHAQKAILLWCFGQL